MPLSDTSLFVVSNDNSTGVVSLIALFNSVKQARTSEIIKIQESPPAWTQEAYRPPCSEYSFCCPNWVPPPPILTWPKEGGYPAGGYPTWVPPYWPGGTLPGYPPVLTQLPGYPHQQGTPPPSWPGRVPRCGLTKWNYYLPVVLRTREVKSRPSMNSKRVPKWFDICKFSISAHGTSLLLLCNVSLSINN